MLPIPPIAIGNCTLPLKGVGGPGWVFMKQFFCNLLATVVCFSVGFVIIHYLFVWFGWSQSEPLLNTLAYGAGMGVLYQITISLYYLIKKK